MSEKSQCLIREVYVLREGADSIHEDPVNREQHLDDSAISGAALSQTHQNPGN